MTVPGGKVQYDITGGTRPGNGQNLFHSFGEFGVPNNNIANFLNDPSRPATTNILGRVTGGNPSNIFGTIKTTDFGSANLFLMNPAGILFGPNATLNVGGSVHFTTADYLRLADGVRFNAIPNPGADALLSTAPVAAFGFLGSSPAAITVEGSSLSVPAGQSLSLVGGDISIHSGTLDDGTSQAARLSAPGGQIRLASVASPGEVLHPTLATGSNINGQTFSNMGTITISENATIDVSGDAAGTVIIRGGQLMMDNSTISADTVNTNGAPIAIDINVTGDMSVSAVDFPALTARTTGSGDAGEIRILSGNMNLTATTADNFFVSLIDTHTSGSGKAGNVSITTTGNLEVTGDPSAQVLFIDSGTIGTDGGQGGDVILIAKNINLQSASINTGDFIASSVLFEDAAGSGGNLTITTDTFQATNSFLVTDGFVAGKAGDIMISARDVQINNFSALSASGFQKGGTIRISTDTIVVDSSQFEVDTGPEPAGGIIISAKIAEFKNGSTIGTQTFGNGAAGNISVTATDHVTLSDDPTTDGALQRPTGFFTNSLGLAGRLGPAGSIIVATPTLEITGGARLDSTTRTSGPAGPITITADTVSISGERPTPIFDTQFNQGGLSSGIYSRTVGKRFCSGSCGDGGPISITTGTLSLDESAQINSGTSSTGKGGDISITAGQTINLSTRATVSANSTGAGDAGSITMNAGDSFVMRNATVNTSTAHSDGGNIAIKAGNLVQLGNSEITTNVQGGAGSGGNISIDPPTVILNHSKIIASAIGGNGGNINIVAGIFLVSPDSIIDASSQFGVSGTITIESPITNLSGTLAPLPSSFLRAGGLVRGCAARLQAGQGSSLTVQTSRDRVPAEPGELLLGPLFASSGSSAVSRTFDELATVHARVATFPLASGCAS